MRKDNKKSETLAQFVTRILKEKDLSLRKVEERAKGGITKSYINKIANGGASQISPARLSALAKGLDEPEEVVFAIARGKSLIPTGFDEAVRVALLGAEDFSEKQRDELLLAINRLMVAIRAENANQHNNSKPHQKLI